jgi:DNA-nicking Smr family endonuclease
MKENDTGPDADDGAVPMEIDGVLDLHMFPPGQVKELVPDWIAECRAAGLRDLRIIHGKGIGVLRTIVHGILQDHPEVESFGHPPDGGSWGATVVRLKP